MAHLYKKTIKGRTYWYIRETVRIGKKVRVKWQVYLGTPETILKRLNKAGNASGPLKLRSQEYGSLFVADRLEKIIGTVGIVDSIVPPSPREIGPSIGEYFFYAWVNRLIEPKSKNSIGKWFSKTAVEHFRNIKPAELNSARFWEKWNRVSAEQIEEIGKAFFRKIWETQDISSDCLMFDTTNQYSYMASNTESELMKRGHSKAGKHYLRQVGIALLVDSDKKLPLFYRPYEGNEHDSRFFNRIIDEMFGIICGFNRTKERLTVVFDKGMNSADNIEYIDEHQRIHFVTTYSPRFAEELADTALDKFTVLSIPKNDRLEEKGRSEDRILAFRGELELWGKKRTAVVTYNPRTKRKKEYVFRAKLEKIRESLLKFRQKFREQQPHWRKYDIIVKRYEELCRKLHIGTQYYSMTADNDGKSFSFRKDFYQVSKAERRFGRNLIVTDNHDWTTERIVETCHDRYIVEQRIRDLKSPRHVAVNPMYHWTDGKIRCHLLVCIIALTMKRLIELKLESAGKKYSAETIIEEMRSLDLVTCWLPKKKKPQLMLEEPNDLQKVVLNAFGHDFKDSWVLQN